MRRRIELRAARTLRLEIVFAAALVAWLLVRRSDAAGSWAALFSLVAALAGLLVAVRWVRRGLRKLIWRLRNRLLVAYVLIAAVPLVLVAGLVAIGAWILTGQIAVYLVSSELDRRAAHLRALAYSLAATPPALLAERIRWVGSQFEREYPGLELVAEREGYRWSYPPGTTLGWPAGGWSDASGLVLREGSLYLWAHFRQGGAGVAIVAPLGPESLAGLLPKIGEVSVLGPPDPLTRQSRRARLAFRRGEQGRDSYGSGLPAPVNRLDREVSYAAPVTVSLWDAPGRSQKHILLVRTRCSAVLRTVFGQTVEWREGVSTGYVAGVLFLAVASAFLIVELVTLAVGINLTRTITRAVHGLYTGTQRIMGGDFSHRIEVRGNDQLAQLSLSFNRMTENLERLLAVAKEKERLQSELEIARELQSQLFPRAAPAVRRLVLKAICQPARLVSGDYYDYVSLPDSRLAMAVGDVAGKGISAALLTATIQSTMRAQLGAARELAAGEGSSALGFSTAALVSRLNQHLYACTPPEKFATFYFAVYDDATGLLVYTNAGHPPPILVRAGQALRLEVNGMVVGAFAFARYEESALRLESGDLLVCFTDGVTEPENEYGEMFGEERLIELVLKKAKEEPEEIAAAVMEAARQWTGMTELQDDITLLVARRL